MTPKQAAEIIGCTPGRVRSLIRDKRLKARKVRSHNNQFGYEYEIKSSVIERYCNAYHDPRGRPNISQRSKT